MVGLNVRTHLQENVIYDYKQGAALTFRNNASRFVTKNLLIPF